MGWTYGHPIRYLHPYFVFYACTGGVLLSAPGDFYRLDSPIPAFQYRISLGSPDSRARGIHACQDAKTPPGPSMTRTNAMVDVAFPTQAQGRHPKSCDFGAQCP